MLTTTAPSTRNNGPIMYDVQRKPGRFGHHPNASTDFQREVAELEEMQKNRRIGFDSEPRLEARTRAAIEHAGCNTWLPAATVERLRKVDDTLRREAEANS